MPTNPQIQCSVSLACTRAATIESKQQVSQYRQALPSDTSYHNSAQCRMLCRVLSSTSIVIRLVKHNERDLAVCGAVGSHAAQEEGADDPPLVLAHHHSRRLQPSWEVMGCQAWIFGAVPLTMHTHARCLHHLAIYPQVICTPETTK